MRISIRIMTVALAVALGSACGGGGGGGGGGDATSDGTGGSGGTSGGTGTGEVCYGTKLTPELLQKITCMKTTKAQLTSLLGDTGTSSPGFVEYRHDCTSGSEAWAFGIAANGIVVNASYWHNGTSDKTGLPDNLKTCFYGAETGGVGRCSGPNLNPNTSANNLTSVTCGMKRSQIEALFGAPMYTTPSQTVDGVAYQVIAYELWCGYDQNATWTFYFQTKSLKDDPDAILKGVSSTGEGRYVTATAPKSLAACWGL